MLAGRLEPEIVTEFVEKGIGHSFPDAHGAIALHIRVASYGADSGSRPAHVAAEQQQVDDLLNRRNCLPLLRQAHRPASDHLLGLHHYFGDLANLSARDSALRDDLVPRYRCDRGAKFRKARSLFINERAIDNFSRTLPFLLEHFFAQALEKCKVAA